MLTRCFPLKGVRVLHCLLAGVNAILSSSLWPGHHCVLPTAVVWRPASQGNMRACMQIDAAKHDAPAVSGV